MINDRPFARPFRVAWRRATRKPFRPPAPPSGPGDLHSFAPTPGMLVGNATAWRRGPPHHSRVQLTIERGRYFCTTRLSFACCNAVRHALPDRVGADCCAPLTAAIVLSRYVSTKLRVGSMNGTPHT